MTDPDNLAQPPDNDPCAEVFDEQLHGFLHDSSVLITAEDELFACLAVLVESPFDTDAQRRAATYLRSRKLSDATRAAHKIGGQP